MPEMALRPKLLGALNLLLVCALGLPHGKALGLGLGRPQILSTLGQPLDASFALSLGDGEQLRDNCLRAEVAAGDARVPAGLLQLRVEGEPGQLRVRLRSLVRIEEPALRVTLALGCPVQFTREFNALVDPAPSPAVTPVTPVTPLAAVLAAAPIAAPPAGASASSSPPEPQPRAQQPGPAPLTPVVRSAQVDARSIPPLPAGGAGQERPRVKPSARPKPANVPAGPRLQLEAPEALVGAAARPAASAAGELTPELEATLSRLEQTVAELKAELVARRLAAGLPAAGVEPAPAASRAVSPASVPGSSASSVPMPPAVVPPVVAQASGYRDPLTWLMTLGLSLIAGAAAFYGSRWLEGRQRRRREAWRSLRAARNEESAGAGHAGGVGFAPPVLADAVPLPDEGQHTVTSPQPRPMPWVAQPPVLEPAALAAALPTLGQPLEPAELTQPASLQVVVSHVSPDEWLDLLQQVDFLERLGQPESVDALLEARRGRADSGPLPYLLQFELCQQRGDADRFARLADEFERQFNRAAPHWAQPLGRGRALDACPSVIAHLQMVWDDAPAALELLERLITQGFGPGVPAFELPAYRDLLLLYGIARDGFEASQRGDGVDLMLPLDSRL